MYDTIIIGAGPSGLFCGHELAKKKNAKTLIVDMGKTFQRKTCNILKNDKCLECKPCNILCGIGGSSFSNPSKLSRYPAGSKLVNILGSEEQCEEIYDYTTSIFERYGLHFPFIEDTPEIFEEIINKKGMRFKYFESVLFSSNQLAIFIKNLLTYLENKIYIQTNFKVEDIEALDSNLYRIIGVCNNKHIEYLTKRIVLATGEAGAFWLNKLQSKMKIKAMNSSIDIGVRVEFPSQVFEQAYKCHKDVKLIFEAEDKSEIRTYCGILNGKTVVCNWGDSKVIDGLSNMSPDNKTGAITIFNRINIDEEPNMIIYALSILKHISKLYGPIPICQKMKDFMEEEQSYNFPFFEKTLHYYAEGKIQNLLPPQIVANLRYGLNKINQVIPGITDSKNILYFPAIDKVWSQSYLNNNMETSLENVFIIGDATGIVRGVMQSAVTGIICGRNIFDQNTGD